MYNIVKKKCDIYTHIILLANLSLHGKWAYSDTIWKGTSYANPGSIGNNTNPATLGNEKISENTKQNPLI